MKTIIQSIAACLFFMAGTAKSQTMFSVTGFNHVESVASDGKYLYAADIGKELNPTGKDGDGKIFKLDLKGQIIDSSFSKEILNAPKGLTISNGILFAADVDRLIALDLTTGRKLYQVTFNDGVSFLNDITVGDEHTLYVSATDKSKIYKVNLASTSYSELITDKTIPGVNGLFYDKKSNRLYVNGFGSDNKPNGIVGFISLPDNTFTRLGGIEGYFDGIWLNNGILYTSNWVAFEQKGIIQTIDIHSGKASEVKLNAPIAGPADFTVVNNQIIIPEMMTGAIQFITFKIEQK